jgi:hypothetical protein
MTGTYKYRYVKINLTDDETAPILSIEKSTSAELTVEPDLGLADIKTFSVAEGSIGFTLSLEFEWVSETVEGNGCWFALQSDKGDGTFVGALFAINGSYTQYFPVYASYPFERLNTQLIHMTSFKLQVKNEVID